MALSEVELKQLWLTATPRRAVGLLFAIGTTVFATLYLWHYRKASNPNGLVPRPQAPELSPAAMKNGTARDVRSGAEVNKSVSAKSGG